jgi:hypothetical protein
MFAGGMFAGQALFGYHPKISTTEIATGFIVFFGGCILRGLAER